MLSAFFVSRDTLIFFYLRVFFFLHLKLVQQSLYNLVQSRDCACEDVTMYHPYLSEETDVCREIVCFTM